ncbi:perlucin-like [Crassostrea angulata]|uniref:perlucin-like n=1 Tax=Magallana angulata TaxID=2784310 RepID=UPI0022B116FB|nr:perlucin-like [Crassostrea angulata]
MYFMRNIFSLLFFCMYGVHLEETFFRQYKAEQEFVNKQVLDNVLSEVNCPSIIRCTGLCCQVDCGCFGFSSMVNKCRVHAFCRLESTLVDDAGWEYYRTSWIDFMNSQYWVGKDLVTWHGAEVICRNIGANLAEIESPEEDNFIHSLVSHLKEDIWLGATDIAEEGTWLSAEKNTTLTYVNWYPGQPNNYGGNQNCLCLYEPYPYDHAWCDDVCSMLHQFVCERKAF